MRLEEAAASWSIRIEFVTCTNMIQNNPAMTRRKDLQAKICQINSRFIHKFKAKLWINLADCEENMVTNHSIRLNHIS